MVSNMISPFRKTLCMCIFEFKTTKIIVIHDLFWQLNTPMTDNFMTLPFSRKRLDHYKTPIRHPISHVYEESAWTNLVQRVTVIDVMSQLFVRIA